MEGSTELILLQILLTEMMHHIWRIGRAPVGEPLSLTSFKSTRRQIIQTAGKFLNLSGPCLDVTTDSPPDVPSHAAHSRGCEQLPRGDSSRALFCKIVLQVTGQTEQVFPWGGFPQAERCRLCLGNSDMITAAKANLEEVCIPPILRMQLVLSPVTHCGTGLSSFQKSLWLHCWIGAPRKK